MTKLKIRILSLFITLFSVGTISAQTEGNVEVAVIQTEISCSHCERCETCGQNFEANILRIKGVKKYELDAEKETLTVYYNTKKTDIESIRNEIAMLGYNADEVKADPAAYDRLDDCCKKK